MPAAVDRGLFREEHEVLRRSFRTFLEREVVPHQERWREAGIVDREAWRKAGAGGFLCAWLDEASGGPGGDFLHSTVIMEELERIHDSGFAVALHSDICVPYLDAFGTEAQRRRWLPGCASGDLITAVAMTEPGTGSDLAAIQTRAVRDGDDYVLHGSKTVGVGRAGGVEHHAHGTSHGGIDRPAACVDRRINWLAVDIDRARERDWLLVALGIDVAATAAARKRQRKHARACRDCFGSHCLRVDPHSALTAPSSAWRRTSGRVDRAPRPRTRPRSR
jgi:hypothetical protein